MAELKQAQVPDIGDDKDVPVIELLVKPGDVVRKDQGLVTLESAKATMEVPSPFDGVVRELKVKLGDALSAGSVVAVIEVAEGLPSSQPPPADGRGGQEPAARTRTRTRALTPALSREWERGPGAGTCNDNRRGLGRRHALAAGGV